MEWELSPEELSRGYSFNQEQRAVLQNLKAQAASEIVTYVLSPVSGTAQDTFAQAVLKGQIQILDILLSTELSSEETKGN
ncbi:hypothetical protein D3C81_909550 [compost metagenome]